MVLVLGEMEDDRMRGCADDETTMTTPLHGSQGRREIVIVEQGVVVGKKEFPSSRARADGGEELSLFRAVALAL